MSLWEGDSILYWHFILKIISTSLNIFLLYFFMTLWSHFTACFSIHFSASFFLFPSPGNRCPLRLHHGDASILLLPSPLGSHFLPLPQLSPALGWVPECHDPQSWDSIVYPLIPKPKLMTFSLSWASYMCLLWPGRHFCQDDAKTCLFICLPVSRLVAGSWLILSHWHVLFDGLTFVCLIF